MTYLDLTDFNLSELEEQREDIVGWIEEKQCLKNAVQNILIVFIKSKRSILRNIILR